MLHEELPIAQLTPWAVLNDIQLNGVEICPNVLNLDGVSKGGGILATSNHESADILLSIPAELALSKESVLQSAKTDKHLRELIDAMSDFVQTPRKAIIVFLLYQMTISSPDLASHNVGVKSPFTAYVCSLPKRIPLPTFLSSEERELLAGTALLDALDQKLTSLEYEFELLRRRTTSIAWCQKLWWDEETGRLTLNDWLLADAMYRSRALELPLGIGDAMVPILDMANHSADDRYNARFDINDYDGRVVLVVKDGRHISENDEVTITYGCGGASEMIFSYGFLEENVQSAREMFLSLKIPEDDPLRMAKLHLSREAPGVRIFLGSNGRVAWESDFVWWTCINQEDGLDFQLAETTNGEQELQALWDGRTVDPDDLEKILEDHKNWQVFRLRAVVIVQQRVERQGELLSMSQEAFEEASTSMSGDKRFSYDTIRNLRELELNLLLASYEALEKEKQDLLSSRTVTEYLETQKKALDSEGQREEDFS